jgi:hypothetical protein
LSNKILLLEYKEEANKLKFINKIISFSFTEIIGKMNKSHCISTAKRNKYLLKYGKKIFKKYSLLKKKNKIRLEIEREIRGELTEYEIMRLLTPINPPKYYFIIRIIDKIKGFFEYLSEWKLIISINNIDYKFGTNGLVRIKHVYKDLPFEEEYKLLKRIHDVENSSEMDCFEKSKKIDDIIHEVYRVEELKKEEK